MKKIILAIVIVMIAGNAWGMEKTYAILEEEDAWIYDQDNFINRIKSAGFNVAIINVLHGDGVKWLSHSLPTYFTVTGKEAPAVDPLQTFIEKARANGIKTWLWVGVSIRREYTPYRDMWPGIAYWYFDLRDEGYRQYIMSCIGEAITYNPDGVMLDFIRMGINDAPGAEVIVEALVSDIHKEIKDHNPKIIIASFGAEYSYQGNNSPRWLDYGLTDVWMWGDYEARLTPEKLNRFYGATSKPNQVMMLTGNYFPANISGMEVVNRLSAIGTQTMKGLYWYKSLTDEQIKYLRWYAGRWK